MFHNTLLMQCWKKKRKTSSGHFPGKPWIHLPRPRGRKRMNTSRPGRGSVPHAPSLPGALGFPSHSGFLQRREQALSSFRGRILKIYSTDFFPRKKNVFGCSIPGVHVFWTQWIHVAFHCGGARM